jgi:acyl carrier protein
MERAELLKLFRTMATEIAEKDFSKVSEDGVIAELGLDSLQMLELVGAMERELEVSVPDDELVGIQTVKQLLDLVEKRKNA